jgi:uncharacterized protein
LICNYLIYLQLAEYPLTPILYNQYFARKNAQGDHAFASLLTRPELAVYFFSVPREVPLKRIFCLIAVAALASVCFAQTDDSPATREDIENYLQVMHSQQLMAKTMQAMSKGVQQVFHQQYLEHKDELPADYEARMTARMNELFSNMPMDDMMQAMVPVYQKHFTKSDVDSLIAFYSSPAGQKLLQEMPAIMQESMEVSTPIIMKYIETVRAKLQKQTDSMIADAKKKPDAAPAAH